MTTEEFKYFAGLIDPIRKEIKKIVTLNVERNARLLSQNRSLRAMNSRLRAEAKLDRKLMLLSGSLDRSTKLFKNS